MDMEGLTSFFFNSSKLTRVFSTYTFNLKVFPLCSNKMYVFVLGKQVTHTFRK